MISSDFFPFVVGFREMIVCRKQSMLHTLLSDFSIENSKVNDLYDGNLFKRDYVKEDLNQFGKFFIDFNIY